MQVIPKTRLIDKNYYEGLDHDTNSHCVARWNASTDYFEFADHRWEGAIVIPLSHSLDESEYYGLFSPLMTVLPKDTERVEKHS